MTQSIINEIESLVLNNKIIGLFVSGGLDSTTLAYLMHDARARLKTDNIFKFFVVPQHNHATEHAKRIINYIDSKFNNSPSEILFVGDANLHHSKQVESGAINAFRDHNKEFNIIVSGTTRNPDELPNGPIRPTVLPARIYAPFLNYTKQTTVQICIDMGLEDIFKISHTCTENPGDTRCTYCWQCKERVWAFKQCNHIDPGTM